MDIDPDVKALGELAAKVVHLAIKHGNDAIAWHTELDSPGVYRKVVRLRLYSIAPDGQRLGVCVDCAESRLFHADADLALEASVKAAYRQILKRYKQHTK